MLSDRAPPQNAMMTPPQGAPAVTPGPGPNAMTGVPQPPAAPAPVSKEQIDQARKHADAMVDGLLGLTTKPRGSLTKQDVFEAASDMIAKGAFPSPSSKQALISELANMPDDEPGMRKVLGDFLLQVSANRAQLLKMHGPGDMGGPPNAGI